MLMLLILPINLMTKHDPPNLEINVQYGSSILSSYQIVNKKILYLPSSLYTFLHNQHVMQKTINCLL